MSALTSWLASTAVDAAIEIAPEGVTVAVLDARSAGPAVQAVGSAALSPGAVVPSLTGHNVADRQAAVEALRAACERAGQRPRRVALVIPDPAARVSLVRFDSIPARRDDLDQLIRWQVKKSSPFPVDNACVAHSPGVRIGAGGEFVVVTARRETIREYESVCEELGMHAGLVDLATLSVVNLYLAERAPAGDSLIVHVRPDYTSIALVRGDDLIFFGSRAEGDQEALADVVHQTAMYYQDRLAGTGFARVIAGGVTRSPRDLDLVRAELEARLGRAIEPLDPSRVVALDRMAPAGDQLAALAPLAGMLLRARREVASA